MILATVILSVVGIIILAIGYLIAIKHKIHLLHSYHYDKVKASDIPAFCRLVGSAILLIGIGILSSIPLCFLASPVWLLLPFGTTFIIAMVLLILADRKYNR
jgi:hypothetical protein